MRGVWRGKEEGKGAEGMPVKTWTMARKLEASVTRTVVGARREGRDRFLEMRGAPEGRDGVGGVVGAVGEELKKGGRWEEIGGYREEERGSKKVSPSASI